MSKAKTTSISVIIVAILGALIYILSGGQSQAVIVTNGEAVPAYVDNGDGTGGYLYDTETVQEVDSNQQMDESEDAQGAYHDTSTPIAYKNSVFGNCITNKYGGQCFALANDFWQNYAGRNLSSCGTGAAKGTWNCKEANAGDDFILITDTHSLQAGDWVVFSGGTYGHIGMALGGYNNGYVALLGENQGGIACAGGGAAANIINKSLKDFVGAFRPKDYVKKEEPKQADTQTQTQTTTASNTVTYTYVKGDYFSKVLVKLGLSNSKNLWGKNGDVAYYTKQLIEQGVLDKRGNVKIGVPFTLTKR